ncbi:MAG: hypothetical protein PHS14_18300 [Elusimicrobia bacterium]|nr:hypothetical protein [Elusimicrobiota bacterium]
MNRLEAVAGASLLALVAAGVGQKYNELSKLAGTPPPARTIRTKIQLETRPERTVDAAIGAYLSGVEAAAEADKRVQLGSLLASLESPEFDGEEIDAVTAKSLSKAVVAVLEKAGDGGAEDLELRRRAVGFLAARVPGRTSRDFVLKAMEEGPVEIRVEALKRVGSPLGVRGSAVYAKVRELGDKGLVPDSLLPSVLRRTGGVKAKDGLLALMTSTDSAKLIAGCAISLQDYRDPELIGKILERLEAVGMIDTASKLPWISSPLLDEHLKSADKAGFRRGMMAMATRPVLVKTAISHVEKGLQSPDPDTRRYAAVAVKKAVVAKLVDAKLGETLLAGRLQVETEPVLKAELTGGLERIHSLLEQKETGVQ